MPIQQYQPQPMRAPQAPLAMQQPPRWQAVNNPKQQPPAVVRGAAPEAAPKFVLPRPEALGVATTLHPAPSPAPVAPTAFVLPRPEALGVATNLNSSPTRGN